MIISINDILNSGFHVESTDEAVRLAIVQAETQEVQAMIGGEHYAELDALAADEPANAYIAGGAVSYTVDDHGTEVSKSLYLAGAKAAVIHIAYAWLLHNTVAATTFGTVQKRDEYSTPADPFETARKYYAIGVRMLQDIATAKGWGRLHQGLGYICEVL